jgi:hypothetical protein
MRPVKALVSATFALAFFATVNLFFSANPPQLTPLVRSAPADAGIDADEAAADGVRTAELLFVHTQTRPLFSPNRRKWAEPAAPAIPDATPPEASASPPSLPEAIPVPSQPPKVILIGIEKTPSGAKALLLKTETSEAVWFKSGAFLEEWTVQRIEAGSIELALGKNIVRLELYPSYPPAGPAP